MNVCSYKVRYAVRADLHTVVPWMSKSFLLETGAILEILNDSNGTPKPLPLSL